MWEEVTNRLQGTMSLENLTDQLRSFFLIDEFDVLPLAGGASSRRYYEINFMERSYFPSRKILLMSIPSSEIDSLNDYVHIDFYLSRVGIPTPRLYEINQQHGWIFLEYQSAPTLMDYLRQHPEETEDILDNLIDFLIQMQEKCQFDEQCPAFQRFFDREKFLYEFEFHVKEQLLAGYFQRNLDQQEAEGFQQFSEEISTTLDTGDRIFVHRDFQSSNIFYDNTSGAAQFTIIDFQDARTGARVYDLVSSLWDSYLENIGIDLRETLLEKYYRHWQKVGTTLAVDEFQKLVDYTVIQRKLHDAGAFAYNFKRFGEPKFTAFIPGAVQMAVERMKPYGQFREMAELLKHLL